MNDEHEQNIDWQRIIRQAFFDAWSDNSAVDITTYTYKISHHFNLDLISGNLDVLINSSTDKQRDIKYHTSRLRILASIFVLDLLAVSDDGKMLTGHNIEIAKHMLQRKQTCIYEQ